MPKQYTLYFFHFLFNDEALTEEDISEEKWDVINVTVTAEGALQNTGQSDSCFVLKCLAKGKNINQVRLIAMAQFRIKFLQNETHTTY